MTARPEMRAMSSADNASVFSPAADAAPVGWSSSRRVAFRFFFVAVVVFSIVSLAADVAGDLPLLSRLTVIWQLSVVERLWRPLVRWTGTHLFHIQISGPPSFQLVGLLCVLLCAAVGAFVWTLADRRRTEYGRLHEWLRIYCRFAVAILMVGYGMQKILVTQADYPPSPSALLTPTGFLDPQTFFFTYLGASRVYQVFAGSVELLAGVLLLFRRTAILGALLTCAAMTNVVVVNWAFHIPMYRISLAALVLAAFLLIPHSHRLIEVLVFGRAVGPIRESTLFVTARANAVAWLLAVVFAIGELSFLFHRDITEGMHWRGRPPLYGAYIADDMAAAATNQSAATTANRWLVLTVDSKPSGNLMPADAFGTIVTMHDTTRVMIRIDTSRHVVTFVPFMHRQQTSAWNYTWLDSTRLELTSGEASATGSPRTTLRRLDLMKLPLLQ